GSAAKSGQESELAALRAQVEELRKSQDASTKEIARLSGQVKAIDAQGAFLVGQAKATGDDLQRVKGAMDDNAKAVAELKSAVGELGKSAARPPSPASNPEATPDQLYAAGMSSLQADEYARAVEHFSELARRFPEHPLASNAQYWVGEAYYRQADYRQALVEFQKVIDGYPKNAQIPEALLKIGLCYRALKEQGRAREVWEQVSREYPKSNAATQARSLLGSAGSSDRPAR
ncbi:MAG TPA: tol-pal system protein YbgF, partial [Candidatus Methylomirabilis sp.]|nr:tol-pal system protein YbgF [Candidatus Methylomirabilis sp.]